MEAVIPQRDTKDNPAKKPGQPVDWAKPGRKQRRASILLEDQAAHADCSRNTQKKCTLKAGVISYNKLEFKLNCTVKSLSEYGARLTLGEPQSAPDTFELLIELDAVMVKCEVIWRGDDQIGIKFVSGFRSVKRTGVQVVQDSTSRLAGT